MANFHAHRVHLKLELPVPWLELIVPSGLSPKQVIHGLLHIREEAFVAKNGHIIPTIEATYIRIWLLEIVILDLRHLVELIGIIWVGKLKIIGSLRLISIALLLILILEDISLRISVVSIGWLAVLLTGLLPGLVVLVGELIPYPIAELHSILV